MRKAAFAVGAGTLLMVGMALAVGAQGPPPPPPGGFDGMGPGPGGPMGGMFEFGGLMGGFAGKVVTGKPIMASFTITRTETLPGNTITNTSTGTFARSADGSTYRDVKFTALGPWASSGKAKEFAYIRNIAQGTEYLVNVSKGTYETFPIREHNPPPAPKGDRPDKPNAADESATDNPSGSYKDPVTNTVYPVDDQKVTRTIPAGAIGNQFPIVITSERWYSTALNLLLARTHNDPRFGTTTYQLSNIGSSPGASLFTPDPSFQQAQGGKFGSGHHHGDGNPPPPAE